MSVCFKCPDRYVGCHTECSRYIKEKEIRDKENARIREQQLCDGDLIKGQYRRYKVRKRKVEK